MHAPYTNSTLKMFDESCLYVHLVLTIVIEVFFHFLALSSLYFVEACWNICTDFLHSSSSILHYSAKYEKLLTVFPQSTHRKAFQSLRRPTDFNQFRSHQLHTIKLMMRKYVSCCWLKATDKGLLVIGIHYYTLLVTLTAHSNYRIRWFF